eukprot:765283-Hanusia_phi.AAC.10
MILVFFQCIHEIEELQQERKSTRVLFVKHRTKEVARWRRKDSRKCQGTFSQGIPTKKEEEAGEKPRKEEEGCERASKIRGKGVVLESNRRRREVGGQRKSKEGEEKQRKHRRREGSAERSLEKRREKAQDDSDKLPSDHALVKG